MCRGLAPTLVAQWFALVCQSVPKPLVDDTESQVTCAVLANVRFCLPTRQHNPSVPVVLLDSVSRLLVVANVALVFPSRSQHLQFLAVPVVLLASVSRLLVTQRVPAVNPLATGAESVPLALRTFWQKDHLFQAHPARMLSVPPLVAARTHPTAQHAVFPLAWPASANHLVHESHANPWQRPDVRRHHRRQSHNHHAPSPPPDQDFPHALFSTHHVPFQQSRPVQLALLVLVLVAAKTPALVLALQVQHAGPLALVVPTVALVCLSLARVRLPNEAPVGVVELH